MFRVDGAIEANPTSNLMVGGFGDYTHLPDRALVDAGLPVSLDPDEPGPFSTTVAYYEYVHMYRAPMADGELTHGQAMDWLRARLRDGIESRFVLDGTPDGAARAADLAGRSPSVLLYDPRALAARGRPNEEGPRER